MRQPARRHPPGDVAGLLGLQRLAGNHAVTGLLAAQRTCIPGHDGPPDERFAERPGRAHEYDELFQICRKTSGSHCTLPNVFEAVLRYPAPGATGTRPVPTGDETSVTGLGPVTHTGDEPRSRVTNDTDPSHRLHPGQVALDVLEAQDTISVRVDGVGTGLSPRANEWLAGWVWGRQMNKVSDEVTRKSDGEDATTLMTCIGVVTPSRSVASVGCETLVEEESQPERSGRLRSSTAAAANAGAWRMSAGSWCGHCARTWSVSSPRRAAARFTRPHDEVQVAQGPADGFPRLSLAGVLEDETAARSSPPQVVTAK